MRKISEWGLFRLLSGKLGGELQFLGNYRKSLRKLTFEASVFTRVCCMVGCACLWVSGKVPGGSLDRSLVGQDWLQAAAEKG